MTTSDDELPAAAGSTPRNLERFDEAVAERRSDSSWMTGRDPRPGMSVTEALDEVLRADAAGDEDRRWELVVHLHIHGGQQAFEFAAGLSGHADPARRRLAADVLSQLGAAPGRAAAEGPFREQSLALLLTMVRDEADPDVLSSITTGLGHLGDERSLAPLARLHDHPDADVRFGVVFGLLRCLDAAALDLLITLSADRDARVRDWATFGLARQTDRDFPRLRAALAARLDDEDAETRLEAVHGLAIRGDERARQPLLDILRSAPSDAGPALEALRALAMHEPSSDSAS